MDELKHLFPTKTSSAEKYTYGKKTAPIEFKTPPCDDRVTHGKKLISEIHAVEDEVSGCLTELLNSVEQVALEHRLESVKIFRTDVSNNPELYGDLTSQAVSRIEIAARDRKRRVFCLTVTSDGRDEGYPSSWSASIDQICAGVQGDELVEHRLVVVSAGNLELGQRHEYPQSNLLSGIQDPAQSWNALTVGAFTEKHTVTDPSYASWRLVAQPNDGLSPSSRTSLVWSDKSWAIKPEIVMEGGNNVIDPSTNRADFIDELSLLTTRVHASGALLTTTGDTSGATALASRYAAIIWTRYPNLWPETVRGLLVHSATWTDAMKNQVSGNRVSDRENRLRVFGYGKPSLDQAINSLRNSATMVIQDSLQPFDKAAHLVTQDMHLHSLPWPTTVLEGLGENEVRMKITLSFFIEPSPGRRGWMRKHRYQSHGLVFDVKRPLETVEEFHKRISKAAREEDDDDTFGSDSRQWLLGDKLRRKGAIHSDTWVGNGAQLARCGCVAVFPVIGWWKERPHLNRWNRQARYSLIITIETNSEDIDLYTPIANQIGIDIET